MRHQKRPGGGDKAFGNGSPWHSVALLQEKTKQKCNPLTTG